MEPSREPSENVLSQLSQPWRAKKKQLEDRETHGHKTDTGQDLDANTEDVRDSDFPNKYLMKITSAEGLIGDEDIRDSDEEAKEAEHYLNLTFESRNDCYATDYPVPEFDPGPGPVLQGMYTMSDMILQNLQKSGMKNILHRITYIVRYSSEYKRHIQEAVEYYTSKINRSYADDPITGLFLYYQDVGLVMIEGNEASLLEYMVELPNSFLRKRAIKWKVFAVTQHVPQRLFDQFCWLTADSPPDIGELPRCESCDKNTAVSYLKDAAKKMNFMWTYLSQETSVKDKERQIAAWMTTEIPSRQILNFCLDVNFLQDVEDFAAAFDTIPEYNNPDDQLWPVSEPDIPYNVMSPGYFEDEGARDVDPRVFYPTLNPPPLRYVHPRPAASIRPEDESEEWDEGEGYDDETTRQDGQELQQVWYA